MNERPDSALYLLNSFRPEDLSGEEKALWCLLITQARDKEYVEHTSDSLIQIAVKYYEKTDLNDRKMQAYYYCGRVFQDLNDALQAQEYYLKAYEVGKNLNEDSLLGRLCANLGTLYTFQELYRPALVYQKKAADCFIQDKDSVSLSMTFRNIARIYVCENQLDSAIGYYSKALAYTSDLYKLYVLNELADTYGRISDYQKGLSYAKEAYTQTKTMNDSCLVSLALGDLYLKSGKIDSAYYYLSYCRRSSNVYTLKDTYHWLSLLEKSRKNLKAYVVFQEKYEALRDSIDRETYMGTLAQLQSMYDYQLVEKEKENYRQEAYLKTNYLYRLFGVGSLLLLGVICGAFYLVGKKKKKEEQLDQSLRLEEQKYMESQQYLAERDGTIAELRQQLFWEMQKREESTQQLESALQQRKDIEDQLQIQLDQLKNFVNENLVDPVGSPILKEEMTKIFFTSALYRGVRFTWEKWEPEQWLEVVKYIDHVLYSKFTSRIKIMYPTISEIELQICCLTKLGISVSRMATLLSMTSQGISVKRKRLYKKMTNNQGTAQDFDKYISTF